MKRLPSMAPRARIMAGSIPEPNSGCWIWLGSTNAKGYAHLKYETRQQRANRFSWSAYNGEIPPGLHVLHSCDNRLCVNPEHLFLGTNQDNVDDKMRKGRAGQNQNAFKTHCPRGHEYTEGNTYWQGKNRSCRTCRHTSTELYNLQRKLSK